MFLVRKNLLIVIISKLEPSTSSYVSLHSLSHFFFLLTDILIIHVVFTSCCFQLRVSAMISNSSYILILDCDMYCNDPTSARKAMCFYCDSQTPSSLAFVQFSQTFRNISQDDIYDNQVRFVFKVDNWIFWKVIYAKYGCVCILI